MKKFLVPVVFAFFISSSLSAQSPKPLDLDLRQVLEIAADRSPDVMAADERVKQAAARFGGSFSGYMPQFSLSASESRQTRNLKANGIELPFQTSPVVGPFNTFDARMTLNQTIFDWETVERIRRASASRDLFGADRDKVRQDTMALAAVLYLDAKRATEKWRVRKFALYEKTKNLKVVQEHQASGAASQLELDAAVRDVSAARYEVARLKNESEEKRLDLLAALGAPLESEVRFADEEFQNIFIGGTEKEKSEALAKSPEVRAAHAGVREAQAGKRGALAEFLPKISGTMDFGGSGSQPADAQKTYTFGAKVTLPVFEGGKSYFHSKEALSAEREALIREKHISAEKQAAAKVAEENVERMLRLVELKESEKKIATRESRMAYTRYQCGDGERQAWLRSFAAKKRAADELEEARTAWVTAQIEWCHALGQMDDLLKSEGDRHEP